MMLAEGEVAKTKMGIVTTPFPRVDMLTNRRATNTIKRVHKWLLDNARMIAEQTKDDWNLLLLKGMNAKRLSPADMDHLNLYLFGEV